MSLRDALTARNEELGDLREEADDLRTRVATLEAQVETQVGEIAARDVELETLKVEENGNDNFCLAIGMCVSDLIGTSISVQAAATASSRFTQRLCSFPLSTIPIPLPCPCCSPLVRRRVGHWTRTRRASRDSSWQR